MSSTVDTPLTPMTLPGQEKALLTLTDAAVAKVKFFAESMPDSQNKPLRVFVQGGGCSGFQYGFTFDEKKEGDNAWEQGGVQVVVDPQSAEYLSGASLDYKDGLQDAGFTINNPNAQRTCGCGQSFS